MIGIPPNVEVPSHPDKQRTQHRHHEFHRYAHQNNLTRRQFLQGAVALVGGVAGTSVLRRTAFAAGNGKGIPRPIPGYSPVLQTVFGLQIPFFVPPETDPFTSSPDVVATPTTIWDFNGHVGVVEADGVSDPAHSSDGQARRWACDVR